MAAPGWEIFLERAIVIPMQRNNEKLVYKGKKFRVYEWEQTLFNGAITTFERVEHIPSVTIFTVHEGKLVIQKQTQPHLNHNFYSLPGGGVDENEEPLAAAKRELLEEEGLESKDWEYLLLGGKQSESYYWENHIYIARQCTKVEEPDLDPGEQIEHLLYTAKEFFALLDHPDFRHTDILPKLLAIRDDAKKRADFIAKLGVQE